MGFALGNPAILFSKQHINDNDQNKLFPLLSHFHEVLMQAPFDRKHLLKRIILQTIQPHLFARSLIVVTYPAVLGVSKKVCKVNQA